MILLSIIDRNWFLVIPLRILHINLLIYCIGPCKLWILFDRSPFIGSFTSSYLSKLLFCILFVDDLYISTMHDVQFKMFLLFERSTLLVLDLTTGSLSCMLKPMFSFYFYAGHISYLLLHNVHCYYFKVFNKEIYIYKNFTCIVLYCTYGYMT